MISNITAPEHHISEFDRKKALIAIHDALCLHLGDSDPQLDPDMTDDEIREEYSVFWAAKEVAALAGANWGMPTTALLDVAAERERQKHVEGWTTTSDDGYETYELSRAAATYALTASMTNVERSVVDSHGLSAVAESIKCFWPWSMHWLKPKSRRCDLVKAGALILAEIERLDRAARKPGAA